MTTISKFKWFWAWQDEKEEAWLHEMAQQGLHLRSAAGPLHYEFEMGEPRNDYYRMDFIVDRKDYQNYLQLFKDAGWEHIGEMGSWQYFRTQSEGTAIPEIYTDKDSKAQKYQRLITILIIFLPIYFMMSTRPVDSTSQFAELYNAGKFIMSLFLILYAYAMVMILRRILQLKNK
jgi:hypothetical protein